MSKAPTTPVDTDDDLDALLAEGPRPGAKECATGWALQQLPPETAAKFRALMANNIRGAEIEAAFRRRGITCVGVTSITKHAGGGCRNCADKS